jgi:hypothetical protein
MRCRSGASASVGFRVTDSEPHKSCVFVRTPDGSTVCGYLPFLRSWIVWFSSGAATHWSEPHTSTSAMSTALPPENLPFVATMAVDHVCGVPSQFARSPGNAKPVIANRPTAWVSEMNASMVVAFVQV